MTCGVWLRSRRRKRDRRRIQEILRVQENILKNATGRNRGRMNPREGNRVRACIHKSYGTWRNAPCPRASSPPRTRSLPRSQPLGPLVFGKCRSACVAGAVNTPCAEIVPHSGCKSPRLGGQTIRKIGGVPRTGCITSQSETGSPAEHSGTFAVNCTCCAGVIPAGTVAVVGVTEMRIPESMVMTAVASLLLIRVCRGREGQCGIGLGKLLSVGAVYVKTLLVTMVLPSKFPSVRRQVQPHLAGRAVSVTV